MPPTTLRRRSRVSLEEADANQAELPLSFKRADQHAALAEPVRSATNLGEQLAAFQEFGEATRTSHTSSRSFAGDPIDVITYINEYWTARQRQANALHEVSYRACFKPQLPRFFIERLTQLSERVYDPFMGRGTTLLEAALLGRVPLGCDINPLSLTFIRPRLQPPRLEQIDARLREIPFQNYSEYPEDLLAFYHPDTLKELCALKAYLLRRQTVGSFDSVDDWIAMVAVNRLTGHSPGFFSVYTLPPNQATSVKAQIRINQRRQQVPPLRRIGHIIHKKSKQLLSDCTAEVRCRLGQVCDQALMLTSPAHCTPAIASDSVALVVTSPPFLNIVQYATDNWLRCWFLGIDAKSVKLTVPTKLETWQQAMTDVFRELYRVLKPGGHIAFEVGEVHKGATRLEEAVLPCGMVVGLTPLLILINDQEFTKTANCWGIDNMTKGTNTNRIVVFQKPQGG